MLTTEKKMEITSNFIGNRNITDEDLKQDLYLTALECEGEDYKQLYDVLKRQLKIRTRDETEYKERYVGFDDINEEEECLYEPPILEHLQLLEIEKFFNTTFFDKYYYAVSDDFKAVERQRKVNRLKTFNALYDIKNLTYNTQAEAAREFGITPYAMHFKITAIRRNIARQFKYPCGYQGSVFVIKNLD
jgi:hypothetical protein